MSTPIRFGILGTGRILTKLTTGFRLAQSAQLVAVASRDAERARATATQFGIPHAHGSYAALLADPDVDVVFNALHNGLHCEWTCRALAAGKHVLCEKPLACSALEVEQMFATAKTSRRFLMEGFMYRFQPQIAEALRRITAGEIGQVLHVRASYATRLDRDSGNLRYRRDAGGGALMDVGCYCVNAARLFAGEEPTQVSAQAHFDVFTGVDMTLAGMLEFVNGITAHVLCSFESEGAFGVEVIGTAGKLIIPNPWLPAGNYGEVIVTRAGKSETVRIETPHQCSHFAGEIDYFAACVRENHAPQFPPGVDAETDSRGNMRVIEQLLASARQAN